MIEGVAVVSRRGVERAQRGHPWIFRSDVTSVRDAPPGAVVRVEDGRGRPVGCAFHSSESEIRLRLLTREPELEADFLERRIDAALEWREAALPGTRAVRLVHGEGDRLPSLVVDRYDDVLVIQTLSQATERLKDAVADHLERRLAPRGILERNDPKARQFEGLERHVGLVRGAVAEQVEVSEGDVRLRVDCWKGQKTGLFLDQRDNHLLARSLGPGRALDAFSYDGGFALQLARGGCDVLASDVSAEALGRLEHNAALNGLTVATREANAFDLLRELDEAGERFDVVVLDPPAFAKSRSAVEAARRGYREINRRALRLLRSGGRLLTCSCSYHVSESDFESLLAHAAADAGATVSIAPKRWPSPDHPVLLGVPETYYLKAFVLRKH